MYDEAIAELERHLGFLRPYGMRKMCFHALYIKIISGKRGHKNAVFGSEGNCSVGVREPYLQLAEACIFAVGLASLLSHGGKGSGYCAKISSTVEHAT